MNKNLLGHLWCHYSFWPLYQTLAGATSSLIVSITTQKSNKLKTDVTFTSQKDMLRVMNLKPAATCVTNPQLRNLHKSFTAAVRKDTASEFLFVMIWCCNWEISICKSYFSRLKYEMYFC